MARPNAGVLNVERDADHGRVGARGEEAAVEQGERGLLLGVQERQPRLESLLPQRPVEGESEDLVAPPAGRFASQQEVAAARDDEAEQGGEQQKKEEPSHRG